jgi:Zn-dependent metalloprotease
MAGVAAAMAGLLIGRTGVVHAQLGATAIAATDGSSLRSWDSTVDAMLRSGELRPRRIDADAQLAGRTHDRMEQFFKGVRVRGGDVVRQVDGGLTLSIFGTVFPDVSLDVTPKLSVQQAAAIVKRESGIDLPPARLPALLILPEDGGYRLVYTATAVTANGAFEYFIDAASGAIVMTLDAAQRQSAIGQGTGVLGDAKKMSVTSASGAFQAADLLRPPVLRTYDMKENLTRTIDILNGVEPLLVADRATDTDNVWTDRAAVDAHAYAGYVYDYYFKRHGRRGLDNRDAQVLSMVHTVPLAAALSQPAAVIGQFYVNAFYYQPFGMVYGEGLPSTLSIGGQRWNYLSGALDVTGHELTHGVIAYTSGLLYQNESGALNESFSDMMGTAVEFYYQQPGSTALTADYSIAEDVVTPGGLRSMSNPAAFGQPDHYSRRFVASPPTPANDNGGVHINSGIGNQAYYLAIQGGANRTSGLTVAGVGVANRELIEKVMYRAFTQLMPANATYAVARAATIQAARDLYGANSPAEQNIAAAWTAVGVN